MKRLCLFVAAMLSAFPALAADQTNRADQELAEYFRAETLKLSDRCLADTTSLNAWKTHRDEYRRELQEMLGLWPMPERTDLKPVVTGRIERDDFTVEKLQFQASPGLYVTANLFLPKHLTHPAPTILYECGHWRFATNGVSYGNKAVYQTDGAWFARNGYVCLVTDTVLAGEIQGIHTGTRDRGLWWWNSRGYTPAGVEAWFGIRALDYLSTRPEVDTNRFGITGHSGGGAYSWMITALDDRIKVAAPLAGMADLRSHILDGVIDSHCDCNFFVNYYRWDFPQVAALAAPRPLLIGGTDADRLFNLPNTERIYEKVRRVYRLYGATNKLGLVIAPGPHDEVPELQLAVMRWFNRHLKGEEKPVETVAKRLLDPTDLKVFATLPTEAINADIADTFVPVPTAAKRSPEELRAALRGKVFAAWPEEGSSLLTSRLFSTERDGVALTVWDVVDQEHVGLRLYVLESPRTAESNPVVLTVLDQAGWTNWLMDIGGSLPGELSDELKAAKLVPPFPSLEKWAAAVKEKTFFFFAPRGAGLNAWSGDVKAQTKIRRRFMALGQTVDGMRVWDIRCAVHAIDQIRNDHAKIELRAQGLMAVNTLYAALFEPSVTRLELRQLPASQLNGPDYLGVMRITDLPPVIEAVKTTADVNAN